MKSVILPGGVKRAIHVFVPNMAERQAKGWKPNDGKACMAVRSALYNYTKMRVYRKIEILGPSELVELDEPLPGTNGRAVCILFTSHALKVYFDDAAPETVDTSKDMPKIEAKPEKIRTVPSSSF